MSDDDPHWPLRVAFRIAWFIGLPFAAVLLWLLSVSRPPPLVAWPLSPGIIGGVVGSAKLVFRRGGRR